MRSELARLPIVDAFKAGASQLIVLHHLAFYGPMSDAAFPIAPTFFIFLSRYGKMAVQIFFVVSGFLAARHLLSLCSSPVPLWRILGKRYLRLCVPYYVALLIAIFAAALARSFMDHESIPAPPSFDQFFLHLLFLQNIFAVDSLSAGVWYIAIDFQLFFIVVLVFGFCCFLTKNLSHRFFLSLLFLVCLGLSSLFFFNRDEKWDFIFLYFAAYYVIGMVAYPLALLIKKTKQVVFCTLLLGVIISLALGIDFRGRFVIAFFVALSIIFFCYIKGLRNKPESPLVSYLGQISYSVFLIHFPVCLVVNALFNYWEPNDPWFNFLGVLFAWICCTIFGALFFHAVEKNKWEKFFLTFYLATAGKLVSKK